MIREAYFRLSYLTRPGILMMSLVHPITVVNAGGWWNHRSVVAVPTGPSVGTVTGAAPFQIFTGSAVASVPAVTSPQGYSYAAPTAVYSAPVQPYSYGVMMPVGIAPTTAASAPNAFAATGNSQNDDLVRELANRLRSAPPNAASAPAQSAASASSLTDPQLLQEIGRRNLAGPAPVATSPQQAYGYTAPQPQQQAYTPVLVGYSYAAPAPTSAAPQMQAVQGVAQQPGMSLVPVQLYKQKSFLGHEKLRPVSVYPYGVR